MMSKETLEAAKAELRDNKVMADGGMPEYLTDENPDWENFRSQAQVTVLGSVLEQPDGDILKGRSRAMNVEIRDSTMKEMTWTERLEANIINVEAWLHDHWLESIQIPEEMELDDDRTFLPDLREAEVRLNLDISEVIKAARQRAAEDSSHFLFVLGNWTYLAEKHDHVHQATGQKLRRAFERGKQNSINPPHNANCEEFGGGRDDY
jgi:hypothetical protein